MAYPPGVAWVFLIGVPLDRCGGIQARRPRPRSASCAWGQACVIERVATVPGPNWARDQIVSIRTRGARSIHKCGARQNNQADTEFHRVRHGVSRRDRFSIRAPPRRRGPPPPARSAIGTASVKLRADSMKLCVRLIALAPPRPLRRTQSLPSLSEQPPQPLQRLPDLHHPQHRPQCRLVRRNHRLAELLLPPAMCAMVGKLPPGTTSTSISGRSMRANASRAFSAPSLPIA